MATPPPQQTTNTDFSSLSRSVTWRLHLGLLKLPAELVGGKPTLEDVMRHNAVLIQEEQSHYERLQATYANHLNKSDSQEDEKGAELEDEPLSNPSSQDLDPLTAAPASLDPLTAMLQEEQARENRRQELDLRYRKERARLKRGLAIEAKVVVADCDEGETAKRLDADTLNIVDKDLHRLPSPKISDFEGVSIEWETDEQREAWIAPLREILYIFGQEHPHIGYRQGMHEVASYLWMALEIDRKVMHSKAVTAPPEMQKQMQDQSTLLFSSAVAYCMLRSILGNVRQSFDVKVASNSHPLEDMAHSILAKIKQQHNYHGLQDQLTPVLLSLSVPPQLYCTKWIRLLFSREVLGAQNVILLWDVFIELVAEGWEWMAILETTAASRILLCRDQLLDTSMPDYSPAAHHHSAMDLLMNMPPMENIDVLVGRLKGLLELQKYTQCMHQEVAKQDDAKYGNPLYSNGNGNGNSMRHNAALEPQHRQNNGGFPIFGEDVSSVFSLKSIRNSLEQSAQQISSSSDTWKKRLTDEWNVLTQQSIPQQNTQQVFSASQPQRSFMVDGALFGDQEGLQAQQQPGLAPPGYPQPVASINSQHTHNGMAYQQEQRPQQLQHHPQQQGVPVHPQSVQASGTATSNGMVLNPLSVPNNAASVGTSGVPRDANTSEQKMAHTATLPSQGQGQLPHELALRLGSSVAVLQDFVLSVARPTNQNQYPNLLPFQNGDMTEGMSPKVPNTVWEALADVEAVRNVLLQQSGQSRGRFGS